MRRWASDHLSLVGAESYKRFVHVERNPKKLDDDEELRYALLDFIADFANWDNSAVAEYLEISRSLTQAAHEALGGAPGTKPLVVDPFAGGGAIPLEALRVGADAFASDLNPLAVLLNKVVLEYIPKYGKRLAGEIREWGEWVKKEVERELTEFYPTDPDGATPIAYLWARTIICEGPGCGVKVPLIRNMQLTNGRHKWHLTVSDANPDEIRVSVSNTGSVVDPPTVSAGSVTCPRRSCGYTTPAKAVKTQLVRQRGGARNAMLLAVFLESAEGRYFRNPTEADIAAITETNKVLNRYLLPRDEVNPVRPYANTRGLSAVTRIGAQTFGDLYTARQALAIRSLQRAVLSIKGEEWDPSFRKAVLTTLNCAVSRLIFQNCSLSRWNSARSTIEGAFSKQALQVVWDFAESNPISNGPANWDGAIDWVAKVVEANSCLVGNATVEQVPAQTQVLPDDAAQALITDPPYFAAIPYSDLSNVFYAWERDFIKVVHPSLFTDGLIEQQDEIVVTDANKGRNGQRKTPRFFREEVKRALDAARRTVTPSGIGVVVFADSSTESWEAILGAVIDAGWSITGSWPVDTERQSRTRAFTAASLQSSIHIVCRPRENPDGSVRVDDVGDWRDVLQELPERIHQWMLRLAQESVVGADAIFACLGPALEIFSRYSRVEKASGEQVSLKEYLEKVWEAVSREALSTIFEGADALGFEEDARLTAIWFWVLKAAQGNGGTSARSLSEEEEKHYESPEDAATSTTKKVSGYPMEYDAARKLAQGLGADLKKLNRPGGIISIQNKTAVLNGIASRERILIGQQLSLFGEGIDIYAGKAVREIENPTATLRSIHDRTPRLFDQSFKPQNDLSQPSLPLPNASDAYSLMERLLEGGSTVLDRLHQAMLLFGRSQTSLIGPLLNETGMGADQRFWRLAQALSALYPANSDEKRWVDGVLARRKSLGF
jgi:adenine-specific DNA methylase